MILLFLSPTLTQQYGIHNDTKCTHMHTHALPRSRPGLKSPRSWREFWSGIKAPSRKLGKEEVEERIKSNFAVFKANYIVLLAAFMSMSIVSSPFTFGIVLLCLATFALLLGWRGPVQVLGHQLTPRDRMAAAGAVSLFFLVMSGALAKLFLSFTVGLTCTYGCPLYVGVLGLGG